MDRQPAPPHEASYTARIHRNELRIARDYRGPSAAARKRIVETRPDAAELQFVGATISCATGERFCYLNVERESAD